MTKNIRIKNQSLLQLLGVVVQLGSKEISSRLFVDACRERGLSINESYFLHFDTLIDYGFLAVTETSGLSTPLSGLIDTKIVGSNESWDMQFSLTHSGLEYFGRYG